MSFLVRLVVVIAIFFSSCTQTGKKEEKQNLFPTKSSGSYLYISENDVSKTDTFSFSSNFGKYVEGYNWYVIQAIDSIQAKFPDGGGYFIGISAVPTESPIGYNLSLFGEKLLEAPRKTSYCSGSSYTAFIEAMNLMYPDSTLTSEQTELLRMQEPDGGRRNDGVKFWGKWNANGYGSHYALVSYAGMGKQVEPREAMPGDFMNISWKSGIGHSVVFLGWLKTDNIQRLAYWSSQKSTNGLGLDTVNINRIKDVVIVRLTNPEKIFNFKPNTDIKKVSGDTITLN